jgi:hypothetical protein
MNNSPCVFYNKSFVEDLYPYRFKKNINSDTYTIEYTINSAIKELEISLQFPDFIFKPQNLSKDRWTPIIIDRATSKRLITHNYLASGFSIQSHDLGIQSVVKFLPEFKNWISTTGEMVIDWILTSPIYPYFPEYGIMCWAKKTQTPDSKSLKIEEIPYNTIVYSNKSWSYIAGERRIEVGTSTKLIKKTNNALLIIDQDVVKRDREGNIIPNTSPKYFVLSDLINYTNNSNTTNDQATSNILKKEDIMFNMGSSDSIIYHISRGEAYSYYESEDTRRLELVSGLAPKSYISPVLHDIYRQIYHNMTLQNKKEFIGKIPKPIFNKKEGRVFKQLCYFLATHPQIDSTSVSILQKQEIITQQSQMIQN